MDAEIAASPMLTPYIMVIEGATQQYFVVAEKQIVAEVNKFDVAITARFAVYYMFDVQYPKESMNTMLFIERFILGIITGPMLSKTVLGTVSDIQKVKV